MRKELMILAVVVCAVLSDNYSCLDPGEALQCFETDPGAKFCLISKDASKTVVVCTTCRKMYEYCRDNLRESRRPDYDCGAGWESTPCTAANSDVPAVF